MSGFFLSFAQKKYEFFLIFEQVKNEVNKKFFFQQKILIFVLLRYFFEPSSPGLKFL